MKSGKTGIDGTKDQMEKMFKIVCKMATMTMRPKTLFDVNVSEDDSSSEK